MSADPIAIARDLLRCRSITPAEGGALKFLERTLKAAGFTVQCTTFKEPGAEKAWKHPPFAGETDNGELYGCGAVDMKGGIACAVAAVVDYLTAHGGKPKGSISFLITGDE